MSEKLISAKWLINHLEKNSKSYLESLDVASMILIIREAPAVDAIEVVRCKDCEHYLSVMYGSHCQLSGTEMDKDGYCSYGERKEANEVD